MRRVLNWVKKRIVAVLCILLVIVSVCGCGVQEVISDRLFISESADVPAAEQQSKARVESADASVECVSKGKYAYSTVAPEVQTVYDEILYTILSFDEKTVVSTLDEEVLAQAYKAVMCDYGGLFWVDGYSYYTYTDSEDEVVSIEFEPQYTMTKSEKDSFQEQVDDVVEAYLSGISPAASDYVKAKYVFDQLIEKTTYNQNADQNQNILSVFLHGSTVCQGYSCAMQYLLTQLDIPCIIVTGYANGVRHAWNIAMLDGAYYCIDVTWGNSSYSVEGAETAFVNYAYFCVTSDELAKTHTTDMGIALPECTATEDNYYVQEGLLFSEFTETEISERISEAYEAGTILQLKFTDEVLYDEVFRYYMTDQHISDVCNGITQVRYIEDLEHCLLVMEF